MSTSASPQASGEVVVADLAARSVPSFGDIPLECIRASKTNPRKKFVQADLEDLANSIKTQGVAQPILVRPREVVDGVTYFEIVAGERRFRASGLAGMPTIPALVRDLTDQQAYEIQVLENLQRVDLHPLEEAEGFEVLMEDYNVTADELAEKVGKSKAYIYASLKLCSLGEPARKAFYADLLNKSTALLVARIPVPALQLQCMERITTGGHGGPMSYRNAFQYVENNYMLNLKKADFKIDDGTLLPKAGSCSACPKRSGNQPILFSDVNADVCTDPVCYKAKAVAHVARSKAVAIEAGKTVLSGDAAKKVFPERYGSLKGGFVKLDDSTHHNGKNQTYRQILAGNNKDVVLLDNPHAAELIKVVKLSSIQEILAAKGSKAIEDQSSSAQEKKFEAWAKVEREYRERLFLEIHHASLMKNLVDEDLRLIAIQVFDRLPGNSIQEKLIVSLFKWEETVFTWPDRNAKVIAAILAFSAADLNQFIRACILSHDLHINTYTTNMKDQPAKLQAAALRMKVDAKAIRKTVDDAAKAKAALKKATSDKKATKAAATAAIDPEMIKLHGSEANYRKALAKDVARQAERTKMQASMPLDKAVLSMEFDDMESFIKTYPTRVQELAHAVFLLAQPHKEEMLRLAAIACGLVNGLCGWEKPAPGAAPTVPAKAAATAQAIKPATDRATIAAQKKTAAAKRSAAAVKPVRATPTAAAPAPAAPEKKIILAPEAAWPFPTSARS